MVVKQITLAGCVLLLFFFQAHPYLPFGRSGIRPDLILIFVMYVGVAFPLCRGALLSSACGYGLGLLSGATPGLYFVLYLSVFLLIRALKKYFNFDSFAELLLLLLVCIGARQLLLLFAFFFIYEYRCIAGNRVFLLEAAYTALLFVPVFLTLCRVYRDPRQPVDMYTSLSNVRRVQ